MVSDSKSFNNVFWVLSRSMQNYLWLYPFIYVFWPRNVHLQASQSASTSLAKSLYSSNSQNAAAEIRDVELESFEGSQNTYDDLVEDEVASVYTGGGGARDSGGLKDSF